MEKEKLLNANVQHKRFGTGQVTSIEGEIITVHFEGHGDKSFVYPDAFGTFLSLENEGLKDIVIDDKDQKKEASEARHEDAYRAHQELLKTQASARKKRKTPTKRKTTKKKT